MKYIKNRKDRDLEMIVEGVLYYLDTFSEINDILSKRIGIIGEIAKSISNFKEKTIKSDISFIDVASKDGYLNYTSSDKVKNLYDADTFRSYKDNTEKFIKSPIKIGKFINTILPNKYSGHEVEQYVKSFINIQKGSQTEFKILEGKDLVEYYNERNYYSTRGTMASSCMRYNECRDYLKILEDNPTVCKMLALFDSESNKLLARALLWTVSGSELFTILMDRIYFTDISEVSLFRDYAIKNGYGYKTEDTHSTQENISFNDKQLYISLSVKCDDIIEKKSEFNYLLFPYLDTFTRYNFKSNTLYNDSNHIEVDSVILMNDHGGISNSSNILVSCFGREDKVPLSRAVYSEYRKVFLSIMNAVEVKMGSEKYIGWYHEEDSDITYDESNETYININDGVYSEYRQCYIFKETAMNAIVGLNEDNSIAETSYVSETDGVTYFDLLDKYDWFSDVKYKWIDSDEFGIIEGIIDDLLKFENKKITLK